MAGKKPKKPKAMGKKPPLPRPESIAADPEALRLLDQLFDMVPENEKRDFVASLMGLAGGSPPEPPASKRRTSRAERSIERLLDEARSQPSSQKAIPLLLEAQAQARQALGKRFDKLVGRFGSDPLGDFYLTIQMDLARTLNAAGDRPQALAHAEEMLRLDPSDPAGARLLLLASYFDSDRVDDADRLLRSQCPERWSAWQFGRLLVALRRGQRGPEVDKQLQEAHRDNPYVLSLLLGSRMPDAEPPGIVEVGEDSEAQELAQDFLPAWKETAGAISWLREAVVRLSLDTACLCGDEPPRRLTAREFSALAPHAHPTWIAGLHAMASFQMPGETRSQKHWLIFAFSPDDDLIGFDLSARRPTTADLWESLVDFMLDEQNPGRPAQLLLHPANLVGRLKKEAARAKIALAPYAEGDRLSAMLEQLADRVRGAASASQSLDPNAIRNAPLDVDEVWEAAVVHLDRRLMVGDQSLRPCVALVMSRTGGVILWHELFTESPPDGALANAVRMAIARPAIGASRRPRAVAVRDHDEALNLQALADEAGFICTPEPELPMVADAVANLTEHLLGGEHPAILTEIEGIERTDLERFYTSAAAYFRAQPWKRFAMDELIRLERSDRPGQPLYGLVMGQSGITLGLAIYSRLRDIRALFDTQSESESYDSFSVMFGEDASIAPADLDAIEQFGWPVATPEAYPDALRMLPGRNVEAPTADGMRFLSAALDAVTWFAQHPGQPTTTIPMPAGALTATRLGGIDDQRADEA